MRKYYEHITKSYFLESSFRSINYSIGGHCSWLLTVVLSYCRGDAEFEQFFSTASSAKTTLGRYYLRSLEQALANDAEPYFEPNDDPSSITLEHVLPKNPNDGEWSAFNPEEVKRLARRIGNLCLLQKTANSNLKSAEFVIKKPVLAEAGYVLTSKIAAYDDWTVDTIAERQGELAKLAVKAWPIR